MNSNKKFISLFEYLARKYGASEVFDDFLTISVCCLSQQSLEEWYFATIKKYNKDELTTIAEMFSEMVLNMNGHHDFLGTAYELIQSTYKAKSLGQFFTPQTISDFMAQIVCGEDIGESVCDPCSGSGRMLMSYAKIKNPYQMMKARFYGADLDHMCVKMTLINCCLNGMFGEFYHMNSLSVEVFNGYQIIVKNGAPCIVKLSQECIDKMNQERDNFIIEKLAKKNPTQQLTLF